MIGIFVAGMAIGLGVGAAVMLGAWVWRDQCLRGQQVPSTTIDSDGKPISISA